MQIQVGISDARISADPADSLVTHALGSCIGVCVYDPATGIGGMLHFQLPDSAADPHRAAQKPLMYADTGMEWLLRQMQMLGTKKERLRVRVAGAAQMLNDNRVFDIGRRNHAAIRKILWQLGLFIEGEQVGGKLPRTMQMNIADGSIEIRCNKEVSAL